MRISGKGWFRVADPHVFKNLEHEKLDDLTHPDELRGRAM